MSVETVRGASRKPASSKVLVDLISGQTDLSGCLFIGYPIIRTADGRHTIDALFLSAEKGIVVFDLVEGDRYRGLRLAAGRLGQPSRSPSQAPS